MDKPENVEFKAHGFIDICKDVIFGKKTPYVDLNKDKFSIRDLIILLRLIGAVNPDEKINIQTLQIMKDNILTSFIRTAINVKSEDRGDMLKFVQRVVDESFDHLDKYMDGKKGLLGDVKNLVRAINNSVTGLRNIKKCYEKDKPFTCVIDNILEDVIKTKLAAIRIAKPELFDKESGGEKGEKGEEEKRDDDGGKRDSEGSVERTDNDGEIGVKEYVPCSDFDEL